MIAVGAAANIVRKRSSLSRSSATVESDRCASASGAISTGRIHGLNWANAAERDPEADEHELDRKPCGGEEAALAEAVAAAEPQHQGEQCVVDGDERDRRRDAGSRKAEVVGRADRLDDEPGGKCAEDVVGEIEEVDVPRVAPAHDLRDMQCRHEGEQPQRVEDERARDDEGRPGVQAVVTADRDAEERRDGRQRQEQCKRGPVVVAGTVDGDRRRRGGECRDADRRRRKERRSGAGGARAGSATRLVRPLLGRCSSAAPHQGRDKPAPAAVFS